MCKLRISAHKLNIEVGHYNNLIRLLEMNVSAKNVIPIKSTNIQRKNHNYIEYSYTMTYLSQHIKSNKQ
jgi:hypothetical protein